MPDVVGPAEIVILELLMLAIPVILLVALFYVVRQAVHSGVRRAIGGPQTFGETSAEEVLRRRYAGGELKREEYLTIRDDIKRNPDA
jgi:uncharacterized membrane protein